MRILTTLPYILPVFLRYMAMVLSLVIYHPSIAQSYAWITPQGMQSKRLAIILEMPIKISYMDGEGQTQHAKLYTDITESKISTGLRHNLAVTYETITWNMEDVIKAQEQGIVDKRLSYTVAQNKLSSTVVLYQGGWDSASARLTAQSGFYYPQLRNYIKEAEGISLGLAYGHTVPISHYDPHYLYFEANILQKLYYNIGHFERRFDLKLGLKVFEDIELAAGFYRIIGLVNVPRNVQYQQPMVGLSHNARNSIMFPYIAGNKLDRVYFKIGYCLGVRKFDLDFVFGGERFSSMSGDAGNTDKAKSYIALDKLWRRMAVIFSYNLAI